jgi:aspartate aminotransferase/aminotransferase
MKHDMRPACDDYRKRRDLIYNGLVDRGYNVVKPSGAFYIFPEAPGGDGNAFVQKAIDNNLLIVPGSVFSRRATNFRISYAAAPERIQMGLDVLARIHPGG